MAEWISSQRLDAAPPPTHFSHAFQPRISSALCLLSAGAAVRAFELSHRHKAKQRLHQLRFGEWFSNVQIAACGNAAFNVSVISVGSERDDGYAGAARFSLEAAQFARHAQAVHAVQAGHLIVHEDHGEAAAMGQIKRSQTVVGHINLQALAFQHGFGRINIHLVVFGQQNRLTQVCWRVRILLRRSFSNPCLNGLSACRVGG